MVMRFFTILLLTLITTTAFAQILTPVKWDTNYKQISANEYDLIFTATIDNGWSIYSQYLENDDGPIRTSFEWDAGDHFQVVGKNEESGNRKESYDKVFQMNVIKFKKKAIFTQRVKATDLSKPISGYLTFMTCDDKRCLPPTDVDFNFALKAAKADQGAVVPPSKKEAAKLSPVSVVPPSSNLASSNKAKEQVKEKKKETVATTTEKAEVTKVEEQPVAEAPAMGNGGDIEEPVQWSVSMKKKGQNEYEVVYTAAIEEGWSVYSQFLENEDGPVATSYTYTEADNYSLKGKAEESGNIKKAYDPVFDMEVAKFKKEAIFTQLIEVKDPSQPVDGYLTFMTCDNTKCLPPTDVTFLIDAANNSALIGAEADAMMAQLAAAGSIGMKVSGDTINQEIASILATYKTPLGSCGGEQKKDSGLIWTFIFGFLGGLVALITPCVFPMIPLTVSYFTKGSKTRAEGIKNGLIYGVSIIAIYVALGLLITGAFGPEALNRLSTHWIPNLIFFALFVVFAFSFFGYYEITLPSSWANKSDRMADRGGLIGTFFMAATLAIVSFSCTGPIIGTALVESATNSMGPFTVMLGFSTALALPFGLFAAFPAWLNTLPSSGSWMTSVKVVLGFLELAFALKFLSVADYTFHWGFLKYELFMGLWVIISIATTLYLFGFIRFPHDSPLKKLSPTRWAFALTFLGLSAYLATGFTYNDVTKSYNAPGLLSGLAPPSVYNFFLPEPEVNPTIKAEYPSFTKCANNLDCFKDYYEGMDYAKKNGKPVLLDFTGLGCVNCRQTEDHIWVVDPVRNNIDTNFVLISLYVDAPDKLEKTLISKIRNNKIRNVGNKWADFQIVNFAQNSQPLYVLMSPDEKVLARPVGYKDGWSSWQDYDDYLNCGLQTFKSTYNDKIIGEK